MTTKSLTDCYGRRLTVENGRPGIHVHASETVGPFTSEQLRTALDEVAPAGSYTRTDEADWKARAEKDLDDARAKAVKWMVRAKETEADRDKWRGEAMQLLAANERLERERDEARGALRARLGVLAEPRPLTPDAITDEIVRDPLAFFDAHRSLWGIKEARKEFTDKRLSYADVRRIAELAFTPEPPTRPEGAEELERLIREANSEGEGVADKLANRLASRGVLPPITDKTNPEKEQS